MNLFETFLSFVILINGTSGTIFDNLKEYTKQYISEEVDVCYFADAKTYMDYRAITDTSSKQYNYIKENMTVDEETGFLFDEEGFIGVALGSYFGPIGSKYYITQENGIILPVVKIEAKADKHTNNGCEQKWDKSVIEFVIDTEIAKETFGVTSNGYILNGNFNNYGSFRGKISKIEKVTDKLIKDVQLINDVKKVAVYD